MLFRPADVEDLAYFLKHTPHACPLTVIGVGSNLLVRDGGIKGVVIRLMGKAFTGYQVVGDTIEVAAGCLDRTVALTACEVGLGGLEFLVGIPGTIGGALRMNAGAYGREIKDVLVYAEALDRQGQIHRLSVEDMGFSYRHCQVPSDWIFTKAVLKGTPENPSVIEAKLKDILKTREETQPTKGRTGGSTFRNPDGDKAWSLIDQAGCRGAQVGQAQVSTKHCNFLLNLGGASAKDIEELGEMVRERVLKSSGIDLCWEIVQIGEVK